MVANSSYLFEKIVGLIWHYDFGFYVTTRDEDPVLAKKPDPGLCTSNEGRFSKVFKANILDFLKAFIFVSKVLESDVP